MRGVAQRCYGIKVAAVGAVFENLSPVTSAVSAGLSNRQSESHFAQRPRGFYVDTALECSVSDSAGKGWLGKSRQQLRQVLFRMPRALRFCPDETLGCCGLCQCDVSSSLNTPKHGQSQWHTIRHFCLDEAREPRARAAWMLALMVVLLPSHDLVFVASDRLLHVHPILTHCRFQATQGAPSQIRQAAGARDVVLSQCAKECRAGEQEGG